MNNLRRQALTAISGEIDSIWPESSTLPGAYVRFGSEADISPGAAAGGFSVPLRFKFERHVVRCAPMLRFRLGDARIFS